MYGLIDDIPPFAKMVDIHIKNDVTDIYKEKLFIIDVTYFKTFTTNTIKHILNINESNETIETLFLDLCISGILANSRNTDLYRIIEHIGDLILKHMEIYIGDIDLYRLRDYILMYVDVLKNNIEFMLDNHGLDVICRLSQLEFNEIINLDKFYIVTDFTSDINNNNIKSNCLYIKIYERINNGSFPK